jgi:4-hydroxybenzoate polyprenyltransferase
VKKIFQFIRMPEWYDSKIPMLLSILLYVFVLSPGSMEASRIVLLLSAFFLFCFFFFSFGYVINDVCDIDVDRKAGKQKLIVDIPNPIVGGIVVFLIIAGILPLYWLSGFDWRVLSILLFNYLLGASYSLKPFRFKERGVTGLVISSSAQRCFPLLVLPFMARIPLLLFVGWFVLSFLAGLRYILIHQYIDYENDLLSGVKTFITQHRRLAAAAVYLCFGFELSVMLLLLAPLVARYLWLAAVLLCYGLAAYSALFTVQKLMQQNAFLSYTYVPLEDCFNVVLPLMLAAQLAIEKKSWLLGLCLFCLTAYLAPTIQRKASLIVLPFRVKFGLAGPESRKDSRA